MKTLKKIIKIVLMIVIVLGSIYTIHRVWGKDILYAVNPELYFKSVIKSEQNEYEKSWLSKTHKNLAKLNQESTFWEEGEVCFFPNTEKEISLVLGQDNTRYKLSIPQGGIENISFDKTTLRQQLTSDLNLDFQNQYNQENVLDNVEAISKEIKSLWLATIKTVSYEKGGSVKQNLDTTEKELNKVVLTLKKEEVQQFIEKSRFIMEANKDLGSILAKITKKQDNLQLLEDVELDIYTDKNHKIVETQLYLYAAYKGVTQKICVGGTFLGGKKSYEATDLYLTIDNGTNKCKYTLVSNGTYQENQVQSEMVIYKIGTSETKEYKINLNYKLTLEQNAEEYTNFLELEQEKQDKSAFQCAEYIIKHHYPKQEKTWNEYLEQYNYFKDTLALTPLKGMRLFKEIKEVDGFVILNNNILIGYMGKENQVNIPSDIMQIARDAFAKNTTVKKIMIPDTVIDIESGCFAGCSGLEQIELPNGLRTIGAGAFEGCSSLKAISIPPGVEQIGDNTFKDCKQLKKVSIPDSVNNIGENAFLSCENLNKLSIKKTVSKIGKDAFKNTKWIAGKKEEFVILGDNVLYKYNGTDATVKIPEDVTCIGGAFTGNKEVTKIVLSKSVKTLASGAFYNCTGLENIEFSENLGQIEKEAFYGCSKLKEVTLPDSVTLIGEQAFADCKSLEQVNLSDGLTDIQKGAFQNCISLKTIYLPENVMVINDSTFAGCKKLVSVTMSDKLTNIEFQAFYQCKALINISLSSGLVGMDEMAFEGCTNLKTVYAANGTIPEFENQLKLNLVEK